MFLLQQNSGKFHEKLGLIKKDNQSADDETYKKNDNEIKYFSLIFSYLFVCNLYEPFWNFCLKLSTKKIETLKSIKQFRSLLNLLKQDIEVFSNIYIFFDLALNNINHKKGLNDLKSVVSYHQDYQNKHEKILNFILNEAYLIVELFIQQYFNLASRNLKVQIKKLLDKDENKKIKELIVARKFYEVELQNNAQEFFNEINAKKNRLLQDKEYTISVDIEMSLNNFVVFVQTQIEPQIETKDEIEITDQKLQEELDKIVDNDLAL